MSEKNSTFAPTTFNIHTKKTAIMKKTANMTKGIIAAGIMLMASANASAQLNGFMKKAKEAAKSAVTTKANEATKKAGNSVTATANNVVETATGGEQASAPGKVKMSYDPFKTYTPSDAAKKADKMASDNEVKKNHKKSPAAIRGAYENLDKSLFPYQPYYKYSDLGLYLDDTEKTEDFIYYITMECRRMIDESFSMVKGLEHNGLVPLGDTGKSVPYSEVPINAFFANFFADPNSYIGYRQMIKAYIIADQQFMGRFRTKLDAGSDNTVTKDGKNTLFEAETERIQRNNKIMAAAIDIAMKSDYENVFISTYSMLTQGDKQYEKGNMDGALTNYREFVTSYENFLQKHPGWSKDDRAKDMEALYKDARLKMQKAQNEITDKSKTPEDMPKTYAAPAGAKQMAQNVVARVDPEHKNATIHFISNGWRPLTRNGFITHRAIDVAWEYKDGKGQRWLNHGTMIQTAEYRGATVVYLEGKYGMNGYGKTKLK